MEDQPVPAKSHENTFELDEFNTNVRMEGAHLKEAALQNKQSKYSTWSAPLVVITVLLCLIVLLLVVILCFSLVQFSAKDAISASTSTVTTGAVAGNNGSPNFSQWANDI
uniref:Uncharacterized protein n=1 Tax=Amphimedon queenslandica TaxID=400682 RepID=A0A1X7UVS9_AMPQE